jgi:hypothetical protein
MPEALQGVKKEDASSRGVERFAWGLLLIWIGAALLLRWGWGVGLVGAGAIVLAAHGWRRYLGLKLDLWGLLFGVMLLICGVWTLLEVSIDLVPVLCIAAGIVLLASTRAASRTPRGGPADVHAASHHRA